MKGIETLIRLHRQNLDVKRVYRTGLETNRSKVERRALNMQIELEKERTAATGSLEALQAFPAYAEQMIQQMRALAAEMIVIDQEVSRLNDEIAEAFQTLKSYELTRDDRIKRQAAEQARHDVAELDEIGSVQFRIQQGIS